MCSFRKTLIGECTPVFVRCLSAEKERQIRAVDAVKMAKLQEQVRGIIPFFTFEDNCPKLEESNNGSKTATLSDLLSGILARSSSN